MSCAAATYQMVVLVTEVLIHTHVIINTVCDVVMTSRSQVSTNVEHINRNTL